MKTFIKLFSNENNEISRFLEHFYCDKNFLIDRIELLEKNNIDYSLYNFSKYIIKVLEIKEIKFCLEVEDIFYFSTYEEYSKFCDSYF